MWLDGLIGMPDNMDRDSRGMFVVSLVQARDDLDFISSLSQLPLVRKLLARILLALKTMVSLIRDVYPTPLLKKYAHLVSSQFVLLLLVLCQSKVILQL